MLKHAVYTLGFILTISTTLAHADTPQTLLEGYATQAKVDDTAFTKFDAARGQLFFQSTHGNDWSCSTCHTSNPSASGKHAKTSKIIEPLAPRTNATRFTDSAKVEKWFKRNCKDVLERECTAAEKGDVITYLLAL